MAKGKKIEIGRSGKGQIMRPSKDIDSKILQEGAVGLGMACPGQ